MKATDWCSFTACCVDRRVQKGGESDGRRNLLLRTAEPPDSRGGKMCVGVKIDVSCRWEGKDEQEIGRCQETDVVHVRVDPKYFRPTEVVSQFTASAEFLHFEGKKRKKELLQEL